MALISQTQAAKNEQKSRQFGPCYLSLALAAWLCGRNFTGSAKWMRLQAQEEAKHAMKFFDHLDDRDGQISLEAIDKPRADWKSVLAVFEAARKHEAQVSSGIHKLYELAAAEKDYASQAMLQWFITEQVEEEKTSGQIVETLRIIGDSGSGLLMYDRELGSRSRAE